MLLMQFNVQSLVKICTHAIQWEHTYESPTVVIMAIHILYIPIRSTNTH